MELTEEDREAITRIRITWTDRDEWSTDPKVGLQKLYELIAEHFLRAGLERAALCVADEGRGFAHLVAKIRGLAA